MRSQTRQIRNKPRHYLSLEQSRRGKASQEARTPSEEERRHTGAAPRVLGPYETSYDVQHGYGADRDLVQP